MAGNQVLKSKPDIGDNSPIEMIMLGFFFYGPNFGCTERINPAQLGDVYDFMLFLLD
jgi:hypothetical protein